MIARIGTALVSLTVLAACGDSSGPADPCLAVELPFRPTANGPAVTDVSLEVQPTGIVALVTVTDPQGSENLTGVLQTVGAFPDAACEGTPIVVTDDLSGSGVEESFGIIVDAATRQSLYAAITASTEWPVEVEFTDNDGNRTAGRVRAQVIQ